MSESMVRQGITYLIGWVSDVLSVAWEDLWRGSAIAAMISSWRLTGGRTAERGAGHQACNWALAVWRARSWAKRSGACSERGV